jgi:hypothetical protein
LAIAIGQQSTRACDVGWPAGAGGASRNGFALQTFANFANFAPPPMRAHAYIR